MLYRFRKATRERPKMGERKQKLRKGRNKFKKQAKINHPRIQIHI